MIPRISSAREHQHDDEADGDQPGFQILAKSAVATGFAFGAGCPGRPFLLAIALTISCGVTEVAQRWIPGRHARVSDFIVDAAAGLIGLGMAYVAARVRALQKLGARS
jgi:VanZ family protein